MKDNINKVQIEAVIEPAMNVSVDKMNTNTQF